MFKRALCVSVFLLNFLLPAHADIIPASSKIASVTVYPGTARVTRVAKVNLSPGSQSVSFDNIIPQIDEQSITVSAEGNASVKIFGASLKQEYLKEAADQRVKDLQQKIQETQDQIEAEQDYTQNLSDQKNFLNSIKLYTGEQLPKQMASKMPTGPELEDVFKFINTHRSDVDKNSQSNKVKLRELSKELERLNNELAQLSAGINMVKRSIVVDLECAKAGILTVMISYVVNGADWSATYDARTHLDRNEVELTEYGVVRQSTGEDWDGVEMTLSTARPAIGGRMPYVAPWLISEYTPDRRMYAAASASYGKVQALKAGLNDQLEAYNADARSMDQSVNAPLQKAVVAYADVAQKGLSVTFKIQRSATVLSNGVDNKFPITTQTLKANFEYSTYPKSTPMVYLGSRVANSKDLQLLPGPVNLFLEDQFVGKSSLDQAAPGEDIDLYLGVDENVKVKRELISQKADDTIIAGIQSPNHKVTYTYKLTVENYTTKEAPIKLFDAVPVSQSDRIKVKVFDVSLAPTTKDWKDRKGIWLWDLKLAPKGKQEITYSFSVEYPRDINVEGI